MAGALNLGKVQSLTLVLFGLLLYSPMFVAKSAKLDDQCGNSYSGVCAWRGVWVRVWVGGGVRCSCLGALHVSQVRQSCSLSSMQFSLDLRRRGNRRGFYLVERL